MHVAPIELLKTTLTEEMARMGQGGMEAGREARREGRGWCEGTRIVGEEKQLVEESHDRHLTPARHASLWVKIFLKSSLT